MSFTGFMVRTVTVQTGTTGTDRYNSDEVDWSDPNEVDEDVWIRQRSSTERVDDRDVTTTTTVLFTEPDTTITRGKRVVIDGTVYPVDAEPVPAHTPAGLHHYEIQVKKVTG